MASFSSYANGVKRWYQKLELPMPPERIFGAHMMLIGGLACLIGTYFFASMTMWNDGYVNLTLRPRLISLGIYDPYDTEQIQRVWLPLIGEFSTSKLPFWTVSPDNDRFPALWLGVLPHWPGTLARLCRRCPLLRGAGAPPSVKFSGCCPTSPDSRDCARSSGSRRKGRGTRSGCRGGALPIHPGPFCGAPTPTP